MNAASSNPAIGEVLAGKYRVERILGVGGMGIVVAARHLVLGHQVAVKYLLPSAPFKAETIGRFLREARITAQLQSVHIARTLDMGQFEDGRPFLVMELLEGRDLGAVLAELRGVPVHDVVGWVVQACEGVAEAHAAGIIHRDLKPSNLFLARAANGRSTVKVLDFGISKLVSVTEPVLTRSESSFGSPLYMAPEQLRSARNADPRSDVWAMGVILYEALAGKPPFDGETVFALAQSVMVDTPRALTEHRSDVPPGLSAIVMRCLAKPVEERPASMAELARALAPFAGPGVTTGLVSTPRSDPSDRWTAVSTQPEVPRARSRAVLVVAFAFVTSAVVAAGIVWKMTARPRAPVETTTATTTASSSVMPPEPPVSASAAPPPEPAPTATTTTTTTAPVRSAAKVRLPPPPKTAKPVEPASPFIEQRTNN